MSDVAEWLKDVLGINRYAVVWDFKRNDVRLEGRTDVLHKHLWQGGAYRKSAALSIARRMNNMYDMDGAHWVEKTPATQQGER